MTTCIWLDIESGTYFGAPPLKINVDNWTAEDLDNWHETMSDADRTAWAENYLETQIPMSPTEWCGPMIEKESKDIEDAWWHAIK
jgi:hypothetical protein